VGLTGGALIVGTVCAMAAFIALFFLEETFSKDLDYYEELP
jgi:hypothetical protein